MLSKTDVQRLADLAHLAVAPDELETVAGEMDAILGYVSEVTKLSNERVKTGEKPLLRNIMRADVVTNTPGQYTEKIAEQFPDREGDALKVKKILAND